MTYDEVVLDTVGLAPGGHDVGVVVGNDDDLVDTLGLELGSLGDVAGDVRASAGRGEGTGNRDEDDLLVLELWRGATVVSWRLNDDSDVDGDEGAR